MSDERDEVQDRDVVYRRFFESKQREFLRSLVNDEVIEEHRRQPLGQHSEPLERLLIYFRRAPQKDKYTVWRDERQGCYRIVTLSGERGVAFNEVDDRQYNSVEEAYHAIFLRRIDDLMTADS